MVGKVGTAQSGTLSPIYALCGPCFFVPSRLLGSVKACMLCKLPGLTDGLASSTNSQIVGPVTLPRVILLADT